MDLSPPNTLSSVEYHRAMLRIRLVEQAIAERYAEQQMRCPMHLCIGQEAIAVGVCAALQPDDKVFSNHRAHGHYLAKGGSLKAMLAELYGRATGCCGGRGGSRHLIDLDAGFMGATPIVGGTVPLAVGSAWAARLQRQPRVTVVFFGDGCFEEGVVHESLNFAACFSAMQFHAALAVIKQSNGQTSNEQQRATVGNDPVVAHLTPSFTRCGEL